MIAQQVVSAQRTMAAPGWLASAPVCIAILFNCALCLLATRGMHAGLPLIAGTELAVLVAALILARREAVKHLTFPAILLCLDVCVLLLFSGTTDAKILLDLAIIGTFYCLGLHFADPARADRLVWVLTAIILVFGLFEMFAFDTFEGWFHVFDYYVGKGALDAQHAGDTGTTLAENGVRPEMQGRQLLGGLLSLHRVGSVFLEPVSAGNFTTICAAWVIARRNFRLSGLALLAAGLAVGVLADARFAILSALAIAVFLATPLWRSSALLRAMPFLCILGLLAFASLSARDVDNSVGGRLFGSGMLLDSWGAAQWLGVARDHLISMDTGYSYVIGNLGIVAAAALWIAAVPRRIPNDAHGRMLAAIALYMSLSLCISASFLSIKTAALMWFLLGVLRARPPAIRASLPALLPAVLRRAAPGDISVAG